MFRFPAPCPSRPRRHHLKSEHKVLSLMKEDRHGFTFLPLSLRLACTLIVPVAPAPLDLLVPPVARTRPTRARGKFFALFPRRTGNRCAPPRGSTSYIRKQFDFLTLRQRGGLPGGKNFLFPLTQG